MIDPKRSSLPVRKKCVKTGTPTFATKIKLENIRKIFQNFDEQHSI